MAIQIDVQSTPNPNAVKFNASERLFEGTRSVSFKKGDTAELPIVQALLAIEGVDNIFGINDFVTVTKEPDADWDSILEKVEEAFSTVYGA
ncbi:hypothetical protein J2Z69_001835 [Paenibacillus shirakamiensis]|uniref:Scaffold protein Nfu/NifU N-terminal domain-containing protein n=1 Tax=Paenibacillus shirakamiensis TaxID=1265935 RepID=A0ABS4JJM1_9BACL|nr:NifU N-terminal domain-containing protein [Paenibacillus shirakamiensis]MBP2000804.1 hypothetical protein [Paenibacillus shirakamiensis]